MRREQSREHKATVKVEERICPGCNLWKATVSFLRTVHRGRWCTTRDRYCWDCRRAGK